MRLSPFGEACLRKHVFQQLEPLSTAQLEQARTVLVELRVGQRRLMLGVAIGAVLFAVIMVSGEVPSIPLPLRALAGALCGGVGMYIAEFVVILRHRTAIRAALDTEGAHLRRGRGDAE